MQIGLGFIAFIEIDPSVVLDFDHNTDANVPAMSSV